MKSATHISAQIAQLPQLSIKEIWGMWDDLFEARPGHWNRAFLESKIAYRLQEKAFGGVPAATRRSLEKIGETGHIPNQKTKGETELAPGTTLVREYNGIDYKVIVLPDGRFDYLGQPYQSLSAIARAITGSQWSGPAFFGLRKTTSKKGARA